MKTAYELAMERLNKSAPLPKLSAEQKKQIAELESKYAAKVAEAEISLKDQMNKAAERGDGEEYAKLEQRLVQERKQIQSDLEEKKEQIRRAGG